METMPITDEFASFDFSELSVLDVNDAVALPGNGSFRRRHRVLLVVLFVLLLLTGSAGLNIQKAAPHANYVHMLGPLFPHTPIVKHSSKAAAPDCQ